MRYEASNARRMDRALAHLEAPSSRRIGRRGPRANHRPFRAPYASPTLRRGPPSRRRNHPPSRPRVVAEGPPDDLLEILSAPLPTTPPVVPGSVPSAGAVGMALSASVGNRRARRARQSRARRK